MLITIFASIGCQNLGDELILKNEIILLEKQYSVLNKKGVLIKPKFIVFSYNPKDVFFSQENITYKSYFPIWLRKKRNILKNIFWFIAFLHHASRSDLIIVWGGGIIYDNELQVNKNPLDSWIFRTNIFRFFRKKFDFYAVGLNIAHESNMQKVQKIFQWSHHISVRDSYSQKLLWKLWYDVELTKDPVFYDNNWNLETGSYMLAQLNSFEFSYKSLGGLNLQWKRVGISLRSWYLVDTDKNMQERMEEWKINEVINYLLSQDAEIVLLPHSFHNEDAQANDYIFLKKFLRVGRKISIRNNMQGVYEQYTKGGLDLCIAMRLHSIILSQVYEIPFIALSYSTKTDEILKNINSIS